MKTGLLQKCLIVWSSVRGLAEGPQLTCGPPRGSSLPVTGAGVGVTEVPGWPQDAGLA